jgi:hypothetical protein
MSPLPICPQVILSENICGDPLGLQNLSYCIFGWSDEPKMGSHQGNIVSETEKCNKDSFFWLINEAKKVIYGWIIALKCDSFFWLIKQAKKVVYGWYEVSAEYYEKREDLDKILPKMSLIFCFWMGQTPFFG